MKLRIYAVVLTLLAAGLGIALWKERAKSAILDAQITRVARQNAELIFQVKQSSKNADKFEQRALVLDSQLGSAKSRTTATETKQVQLTRELHETKSQLTEREQREITLMAELATLRQKVAAANMAQHDDAAVLLPMMVVAQSGSKNPTAPTPSSSSKQSAAASSTLATSSSSKPDSASAADLVAYDRRIAELEQQLTQLLTRALTDPVETPVAAITSAPVAYQIVRVGPRDSFVVLDYGAENGAKIGETVTIRRGTTEVARVQISDARPKFALAQVLPATLKGQLQTGDLVVFTR